MRKRLDMAHSADRSPFRRASRGAATAGVVFAVLQFAVACSRAPTFNILGSFFPSWILCGLIGIVLTVAARLILLRVGMEQHLSPLVLVYPCLAAFFTFSLWLLFFS